MIEDVKQKVKELLESKKISGFLGLIEKNGHVSPYLFQDINELEYMSLGDKNKPGDARYPLNKLLISLSRKYPDNSFGILVRGCDERGLQTLYIWNQLDQNKVFPVGIACPKELAEECECPQPYPEEIVAGEKSQGYPFAKVSQIDNTELKERFYYWSQEFAKCIKCYGCRDICPMCFCNECSLENDQMIKTYNLPPETPIFHLARATHMAGRCIDCGLCEEACPADIPLRTLYKKVFDIVDKELDYKTGFTTDKKPPFNVTIS